MELNNAFQDILGSENFCRIERVEKGWSDDWKYCIETFDGEYLLLRVSDIAQFEKKQREFTMMQQVFSLGVPINQPLNFGICENGQKVYQLLTWCHGEDAETAIPLLPDTEQYVLGLQSGQLLRKIHSIPTPENQEDWAVRFARKTRTKIEKYRDCNINFPGDEKMIAYLEENMALLENRPQSYQHGDYHVGNMVLSPEKSLCIIDFNRHDFGDPWEEFNRIAWSAAISPHFATGQLMGYFGGRPPALFFKLLAFYIFSNSISAVPWAIPFGQQEIDVMLKQTQEILDWYTDLQNPVPKWFLSDFYFQTIDGIPCGLAQPFDLSFLQRYGRVFKVFDDQDSGNLCFGVEQDGEKYFVKFAGAPTRRAGCTPQQAIANLKAALPIYRDLAHETLITLVKEESIAGGYAAVFTWSEGDCMGRMYPAAHKKFMALPIADKLRIFTDILHFHIHVHEKNYVAVDFYDGSILYNPKTQKTTICDIDFYAQKPFINTMGRLWGSSRFMSPEEYIKDAEIDEITNVYTMGALAFALFANYQRTPEAWPLNPALYAVANKAVQDDRTLRQQSLQEFLAQWNTANNHPFHKH